jgi:dipeptidyl aminopeptidase/acylaminoacyl peptidase
MPADPAAPAAAQAKLRRLAPKRTTGNTLHTKLHRCVALLLSASIASPAVWAGRALMPEDWYRFHTVSHLQVSPDGTRVAYLLTTYDKKSDDSVDELWTVDWSGAHSTQLTHGASVAEPHFSPDGRYLSFLSTGKSAETTQLWVLPRAGGAPRQLTHVTGELTGYEWSPDGKRVVLEMRPGDTGAADRSPKPWVIDAYQFKTDADGYLTAESRPHLYLLDVASGATTALTTDPERADTEAAFSPDGRQIAFVSNKIGGPADAGVDEIELMSPAAGARPTHLLTTWTPNHQHLQWSPDGRLIAFLKGNELKYNSYITDRLEVVDVSSGKVRALTESLDRAVLSPTFTSAGTAIQFAVEDDGFQYPAEVELASGKIGHLAERVVVAELAAAAGHTAVLASSDQVPKEVYAVEHGQLRALSSHNRELFAQITLGSVEDISFGSRDGTQIHGQIVKPPHFIAGRRYPTILWIHGGPNGQDDHSLELEGDDSPLERQLFATHGFVALAINYRGGTGRGAQFARSIAADWGHKEVEDLMAAVDYAVAQGIADPTRLGVGGWSYGGILTDYVIASTTRFKAAISGAGSANQLATYGTDQYLVQYNAELGPPWRDTPLWMKVSYPFFHADRIRTPTLFLGGDRDFNVPIAGGEQMYQALRTLGVPAELIVYPGEHHVLARPSFLVDCFERYLAWMQKYLGAEGESPPPAARAAFAQ